MCLFWDLTVWFRTSIFSLIILTKKLNFFCMFSIFVPNNELRVLWKSSQFLYLILNFVVFFGLVFEERSICLTDPVLFVTTLILVLNVFREIFQFLSSSLFILSSVELRDSYPSLYKYYEVQYKNTKFFFSRFLHWFL